MEMKWPSPARPGAGSTNVPAGPRQGRLVARRAPLSGRAWRCPATSTAPLPHRSRPAQGDAAPGGGMLRLLGTPAATRSSPKAGGWAELVLQPVRGSRSLTLRPEEGAASRGVGLPARVAQGPPGPLQGGGAENLGRVGVPAGAARGQEKVAPLRPKGRGVGEASATLWTSAREAAGGHAG